MSENGFAPVPSTKPRPLSEDAYQGIVGAIVRELEPHSEADPASLLVQLLVAAGNALGRETPAYRVESDCHRGRLFAVIVGPTSRGRKGTSWGRVEHVMERVDSEWTEGHVLHGGLSTGEGLIQALNNFDSEEEDEESGETFVLPGDKRLLVIEPEFGRVLKVAKREGSTISAVIRSLWDRDTANVVTRGNPLHVKGAHLSIVGHITRSELRREIAEVDILDGFANRFIYVYAERSKLLPFGGELDDDHMAALIDRLRDAVTDERAYNTIIMDDEARGEWVAHYPLLTEERPGLYGAATARAEAQVIRLAVIYALLDASRLIRPEHLRAALEVWRYCDDSAKHIFGTRIGDTTAERILAELHDAQHGYMDRSQIRDFLGHRIEANRIDMAGETLVELGHIDIEHVPTGGRPIERWWLRTPVEKKLRKGMSGVFSTSLRPRRGESGANGHPGALQLKRLLTADEAGELLAVPKSWVLAEARADRIPHVRLGRYVRFEAQELEEWWHSRRRGPWRSRGRAAETARAGSGPAHDQQGSA